VLLDMGSRVAIAEPADGPVAVLVAPWEITLSREAPAEASALNHVSGTVSRVTVLGNRARVAMDELTAEVVPESVERLGIRPGERLVATWKATSTRAVPRGAGSG
jgi:molybdate transport system regulatory protein